jgi:hypothetical protein
MSATGTVISDMGPQTTEWREVGHPHLAVTQVLEGNRQALGVPASFTWWTITHKSSGKLIPGRAFVTIAGASRAVKRLADTGLDFSDPRVATGRKNQAKILSALLEETVR